MKHYFASRGKEEHLIIYDPTPLPDPDPIPARIKRAQAERKALGSAAYIDKLLAHRKRVLTRRARLKARLAAERDRSPPPAH